MCQPPRQTRGGIPHLSRPGTRPAPAPPHTQPPSEPPAVQNRPPFCEDRRPGPHPYPTTNNHGATAAPQPHRTHTPPLRPPHNDRQPNPHPTEPRNPNPTPQVGHRTKPPFMHFTGGKPAAERQRGRRRGSSSKRNHPPNDTPTAPPPPQPASRRNRTRSPQ